MDYDEQPLVDLARAGDRNAFRQLVERHSQVVFRIAWRITGDEALAEDAVQEAFVNAWRRLDRFRGDARFGTWMHRITVNAALGLVRKRTRRREENLEDNEMDAVMNTQSAKDPQPDQVMQQHANVSVPWDNKQLDISFSTFRDTMRPQTTETWTVKVRGGPGMSPSSGTTGAAPLKK